MVIVVTMKCLSGKGLERLKININQGAGKFYFKIKLVAIGVKMERFSALKRAGSSFS